MIPMAHSSPDLRYLEGESGERRRWTLVVGAVATGLGMGLVATGATAPGIAITLLGFVLWVGSWLFTRRSNPISPIRERALKPDAIDAETGLPCPPQLTELLRREIARSQRYGDRTSLAVFDVRTTGFEPTAEQPTPPSPARHIAASLIEAARASDIVARLDETHFVVLLTESNGEGPAPFFVRSRTKLVTTPSPRLDNVKGQYVSSWAGWAGWDPSFNAPDAYIAAAVEQLELTRKGYEDQQSWYRGEPVV
jgi:GGDEF domain-containing protein